MSERGVEERIKAVAGPVVAAFGMELVDAVYASGYGGGKVVRIYIDKPGGVTVDDCADVSRELSTVLDVNDPIPGRYVLEVSSPGLDRPLVKEADFVRFAGRKAVVRTKAPVDGRRNFKVTVDGAANGKTFVTDADGRKWEIEISNIERARLEVEL